MRQLKKQIIIMVPYPAQGHVSPMHKLALTFVDHSFEPVIVLPQYIYKQIKNENISRKNNHKEVKPSDNDDEIKWVALPDGLEEDATPDFFGIESAMENKMPIHLEDLFHRYEEEGDSEVVCVVVDLLASWAIPVAKRSAIPIAGFWPAMLATYTLIAAIPHMLRTRLISDTGLPQCESKICFIPELPIISSEDLPWVIGTVAATKARFKFWRRTLERSTTLKWLLVNSFPDESKVDELKSELLNKPTTYPRVLPIIDRNHTILTKNVSLWEEDSRCLKWLSTQQANSVVYISFGSWVSPIGEAKLKSLALALEASNRPFLWVLRATWLPLLPTGFLERVFNQGIGIGIVVSWAPQIEILQHHSVGCYITHCGWNSTLEALQFQKRLLCYPVAGDQFLNCAYIVQVWRVGLKLNGLGHKDVEDGLARVMADKEMDNRLIQLSEKIMGMQDDDEKGSFMLKAFVEYLNKASSTSIHEN